MTDETVTKCQFNFIHIINNRPRLKKYFQYLLALNEETLS